MDGTSENISSLQVPITNQRRLSLIKNDDFVFPSHKRKEETTEINDFNEVKESFNDNKSNYSSASMGSATTTLDGGIHKSANGSSTNGNSNNEIYEPIWKYTNNPSMMRYEWIRKIRGEIMLDLKRHFGREIMHDRLFSCLCK